MLYRMASQMVRLMAPVLSFTAEEIWDHLAGAKDQYESVHLAQFPPKSDSVLSDEDRRLKDKWEKLLDARNWVNVGMDIRRKEKVKNPIEYYSVNREIKSIAESDIVYLLIDAREDISDQDKKIAAQVSKHSRGMIFGLNKWDLLKKLPNRLQAIKDRLSFLFPVLAYVPMLPLTASSGEGVNELLKASLKKT